MSRKRPRRTQSDCVDDEIVAEFDDTVRNEPAATASRAAMCVLSVFAVIHVLSVIAEPLRFSSQTTGPRAAPHASMLRSFLAPYIDMMYLNHGYFFFAPNPGPSHLVVAVFNDIDFEKDRSAPENRKPERYVLPDKNAQTPRLLYHRYFMFTEFYNSMFTPLDLPTTPEPAIPPDVNLVRAQELYRAISDSYRAHLEAKFPDRRFQVFRIEHNLPTEEQYFKDRWALDDQRLLIELPESFNPEFDRPLDYRFDDRERIPVPNAPATVRPPFVPLPSRSENATPGEISP